LISDCSEVTMRIGVNRLRESDSAFAAIAPAVALPMEPSTIGPTRSKCPAAGNLLICCSQPRSHVSIAL